MASKNLVVILILVIIYWGYDSIANANRKFSSETYWEQATLVDVMSVPDVALLPGSEYGSVLMFASSVNSNPQIIQELIKRGSDVNEVDPIFKGTPLSAAATKNSNPEIINLLVKNGAKVNVILTQGRTPLMSAAIKNYNKGIVRALIKNGANINSKDEYGITAFDYAKKSNNSVAIRELSN